MSVLNLPPFCCCLLVCLFGVNVQAKCSDPQAVECAADWATETAGYGCNYAYVQADGVTYIQSGDQLGDPYYDRNYPIVDLQLAKAGVRLAATLDKILSPSELPSNTI